MKLIKTLAAATQVVAAPARALWSYANGKPTKGGFLALTAFAASLEGYLFAPMVLWQRVLIVPGVIAVFWPDLRVEIVAPAKKMRTGW